MKWKRAGADKLLQKVLKYKILIILGVILILASVFTFIEFYISRHTLTCTDYQVTSAKINNGIKIVQLTDLHNSEFGEKNQTLINEVTEQQPDLVCITGDILNMDEDNTQIAADLISSLSKEFPVYVSLGNHEMDYQFASSDDLKILFQDAGATILDFSYQDITIKGEKLRIGGLYGYDLPENNDASRDNEAEFLREFQNTDSYKVLLTHMPYGWYYAGSLDYWDVDLVLAGHTHGGQVRIPFVGGLYAPDMGWFPGRECGLYYSADQKKVMVLSRGLGSTEKIPRFNNIPEVVTVEIESGKQQW